jgi:DNA primase
VQDHYRDFFRDRVARAFGRRSGPFVGRPRFVNKSLRNAPRPAPGAGATPQVDPQLLSRRPQQVVLACLLNHPFLLNEFEGEIAALELPARDLDRLLRETLEAHRSLPDLDADGLKFHLRKHGFHEAVDGVVSKYVINTHGPFAQTGVDPDAVREGFRHTVSLFQKRSLTVQVKQAERDLAANMSHETWAQVQPLIEENVQEEDGSTGGGIR